VSFAEVAALTIHDVKNRLAQLAGRAETRGDVETLRMALEASETLTRLLVFYKSETGLLGLEIDAHAPADLATELAKETGGLGKFAIEADCSNAPALWFYDETLVRMLLANALHNALRYARKQIVIAVTDLGDYLEFSVRDDGNGYPEEMLADTEASAPVTREGTGLGLRLAKRIAEMHENGGRRGEIRLSNEGGAVFRLMLPK